MIVRVRNLKPGQRFELLRTGQVYEYVRLEIATPSGMRHCVRCVSEQRDTSLHHSCHVRVLS